VDSETSITTANYMQQEEAAARKEAHEICHGRTCTYTNISRSEYKVLLFNVLIHGVKYNNSFIILKQGYKNA
jgi:hypothetical protein